MTFRTERSVEEGSQETSVVNEVDHNGVKRNLLLKKMAEEDSAEKMLVDVYEILQKQAIFFLICGN